MASGKGKSNADNTKEAKKKESDLKKEAFAPVKQDNSPSIEEHNRNLLDQVLTSCTGQEILHKLEATFGMHPLLIVASLGHEIGLVKLLSVGVNVNTAHPKDGNTALHLATKAGHLEILKQLLSEGADLSQANEDGNTAFMVAVESGNPAIVNYLWTWKKNFNLDQGNKHGHTALMLAAKRSWDSCVSMLLAGGAAKNYMANDGRTALIFSAQRGDMNTMQMLVDKGANILVEDNNDCTAICVAIREQKIDLANFLIQKLATTERNDYVKRRISLLQILPDTEETDTFFDETLYPVFRFLIRSDECRPMLHIHRLFCNWIPLIHRHLEDEAVTDKAFHYIAEAMSTTFDSTKNEDEINIMFTSEFISAGGPGLCMTALSFYKDTNSPEMGASSMLPLLPLVKLPEGYKWLQGIYYKVSEYFDIFEKEKKDLDYVDNMESKVDMLWDDFKVNVEEIQAVQADIHGAELVEREEREKAKREKKRERRRQRRQQQRARLSSMHAELGLEDPDVPYEEAPDVVCQEPPEVVEETPKEQNSKKSPKKKILKEELKVKVQTEAVQDCSGSWSEEATAKETTFEKVIPKKEKRKLKKEKKKAKKAAEKKVAATEKKRVPSLLDLHVSPDAAKEICSSTSNSSSNDSAEINAKVQQAVSCQAVSCQAAVTASSAEACKVKSKGTKKQKKGNSRSATSSECCDTDEDARIVRENVSHSYQAPSGEIKFDGQYASDLCLISSKSFDNFGITFGADCSPFDTPRSQSERVAVYKKESPMSWSSLEFVYDPDLESGSSPQFKLLDTGTACTAGSSAARHKAWADLLKPPAKVPVQASRTDPESTSPSVSPVQSASNTSQPVMLSSPDSQTSPPLSSNTSPIAELGGLAKGKLKGKSKRAKAKKRGMTLSLGEFLKPGQAEMEAAICPEADVMPAPDSDFWKCVDPVTELVKCINCPPPSRPLLNDQSPHSVPSPPVPEALGLVDVNIFVNAHTSQREAMSPCSTSPLVVQALSHPQSAFTPPPVPEPRTPSGRQTTPIPSHLGSIHTPSSVHSVQKPSGRPPTPIPPPIQSIYAPPPLHASPNPSGRLPTPIPSPIQSIYNPPPVGTPMTSIPPPPQSPPIRPRLGFMQGYFPGMYPLPPSIDLQTKAMIDAKQVLADGAMAVNCRVQEFDRNLVKPLMVQWVQSIISMLYGEGKQNCAWMAVLQTYIANLTLLDWNSMPVPRQESLSHDLDLVLLSQVILLTSEFASSSWEEITSRKMSLLCTPLPDLATLLTTPCPVCEPSPEFQPPSKDACVQNLLSALDDALDVGSLEAEAMAAQYSPPRSSPQQLASGERVDQATSTVGAADTREQQPASRLPIEHEAQPVMQEAPRGGSMSDNGNTTAAYVECTRDEQQVENDNQLFFPSLSDGPTFNLFDSYILKGTEIAVQLSSQRRTPPTSTEHCTTYEDHIRVNTEDLPTMSTDDLDLDESGVYVYSSNVVLEDRVSPVAISTSNLGPGNTGTHSPGHAPAEHRAPLCSPSPPPALGDIQHDSPPRSRLVDLSSIPTLLEESSPEFLRMRHDPDANYDQADREYIAGTIIKKRWVGSSGFFTRTAAFDSLIEEQRETVRQHAGREVYGYNRPAGRPAAATASGDGQSLLVRLPGESAAGERVPDEDKCHYWLPSDIAEIAGSSGDLSSGDDKPSAPVIRLSISPSASTPPHRQKQNTPDAKKSAEKQEEATRKKKDFGSNVIFPYCVTDPLRSEPKRYEDVVPAWSRWRRLLDALKSPGATAKVGSGKISFPKEANLERFSLGLGTRGDVCLGLLEGHEVVIRRIDRMRLRGDENALLRLPQLPQIRHYHRNICNYLAAEVDPGYIYLVTELCELNLAYYMKHRPSTSCRQTLENLVRELVEGVGCLHLHGHAHGRIQMENILIDTNGVLRLCDFGLAGGKKKENVQIDIQSVGRLIVYILTEGRCNGSKVKRSILEQDPGLSLEANHMISYIFTCKPRSMKHVQSHPYFWDESRKFDFLLFLSRGDEYPSEEFFTLLEEKKEKIIPNGWLSVIDECVYEEVTTEELRVYDPTLHDLLGFMADVHSTWLRRSVHFQVLVGDMASYFLSNFPRLLICVYAIVLTCAAQSSVSILKRFADYLVDKEDDL